MQHPVEIADKRSACLKRVALPDVAIFMAHSSGGTEKRMFQQITRHFVTSDFTK
jgi:hypothetical protein